jgi:putative SOS response-associated peptidase YedK
MCGRYYRRSDKQRIAEAYRLGEIPFDLVLPDWDFNVAPTTFQPVIRINKGGLSREMVVMRWGLVPSFTKQLVDVKGISTINARAETLLNSRLWRDSFMRRRCLVPANGFYEWKKLDGKIKQPYAVHMADDSLFSLAGLWDAWRAPDGSVLESFSIVTTDANELMASIHDRMPVIVDRRDYERWLEQDRRHPPPIELLRPYESDLMAAAPCNSKVGNAKNNGPEMLVAD